MSTFKKLLLNTINASGGTQSRAALNQDTVSEYAEALGQGAEFPPVVVFSDGSESGNWLADGFHRYHAHRAAGMTEIVCDARIGTRRDAILFSLGANASHGLRRTNEDKRRAVMTMLADAEWSTWSDRDIARQCGVSHPFVAAVRSPAAAVRQQVNRETSVVKEFNKVESDSTLPTAPSLTPASQAATAPSNVTPPHLATATPEADDEPDLTSELEAADKEIRRLTQLLDMFTSGADLAKQVADWSMKFDQLSGRNAQLTRTANEAQAQARYQADLLAKIRKALGVQANSEILTAIIARRTA